MVCFCLLPAQLLCLQNDIPVGGRQVLAAWESKSLLSYRREVTFLFSLTEAPKLDTDKLEIPGLERQEGLQVHWPPSLSKSASYRFSEKPCLKKLEIWQDDSGDKCAFEQS